MNNQNLQAQLKTAFKRMMELRVVVFLIVVAMLYLFVIWRVNVLTNVEPDATAIETQSNATKSPHIDQATVDKIRQLQDNSVNVQTLFDQARKNPFQE